MSDVTWLHDIILVNETGSGGDLEPADVEVFRSIEDACAYLEPWWLRGGMD
jgi:hypothetical protein